ncbi:PhzF family phenazine biosynthesis protein [soil metagenome]
MERRFQQVDVFGTRPYTGNPVAVVTDAEGLTDGQMLQLTRWTNLSEAAFLLPPTTPEADYRVRIFTLAGELPFAGHPTLGSCHAWLASGGKPRHDDEIVQECGVGLVGLRRRDGMLWFAAPPLVRSGPVDEAYVAELAAGLGVGRGEIVDAAWVDNGPGWVCLLLRDAAAVLSVEPAFEHQSRGARLDIGLVGMYPPGSECAIEVRALFPEEPGILRADPVTGSLNASIGQWLLGSGRLEPPYVASQGTRLGRLGRPRIDQDAGGQGWVGGQTFTCIRGTIEL